MKALMIAALIPVQAISAPEVSLVDFGVICAVELAGQRDAPLTESGTLNLIDQGREIDVTTTVVPAAIGLSFGIRAQTLSPAGGSARVVVTHPPMGPRGVTVESWTTPLEKDRAVLNLFSFDHDYELVLGHWTFQLVSSGQVLVEQRFDVVPPLNAPTTMDRCFPEPAIS